MSKPYCGCKTEIPIGKKKGTKKECIEGHQVRLYGLNQITPVVKKTKAENATDKKENAKKALEKVINNKKVIYQLELDKKALENNALEKKALEKVINNKKALYQIELEKKALEKKELEQNEFNKFWTEYIARQARRKLNYNNKNLV